MSLIYNRPDADEDIDIFICEAAAHYINSYTGWLNLMCYPGFERVKVFRSIYDGKWYARPTRPWMYANPLVPPNWSIGADAFVFTPGKDQAQPQFLDVDGYWGWGVITGDYSANIGAELANVTGPDDIATYLPKVQWQYILYATASVVSPYLIRDLIWKSSAATLVLENVGNGSLGFIESSNADLINLSPKEMAIDQQLYTAAKMMSLWLVQARRSADTGADVDDTAWQADFPEITKLLDKYRRT